MLLHWEQDAHFAAAVIANSLEGTLLRVSLSPTGSADPRDCERSELLSEGGVSPGGRQVSLACSAAAPSRLRHALSSARLMMLLHWEQDAHFAAAVIANSLEGTLLRVSLAVCSSEQIHPSKMVKDVNQSCVRYQVFQ